MPFMPFKVKLILLSPSLPLSLRLMAKNSRRLSHTDQTYFVECNPSFTHHPSSNTEVLVRVLLF